MIKDKITVLFPVTDLTRDGAQRQLYELVKGMDKDQFKPIVLTLSPGGVMEPAFKEIPGARLISLKRKSKYDILFFFRLLCLFRKLKVDVVQPFLTPATLYGLIPALLVRTPVKIVTERNTRMKRQRHLGYRAYLKIEDILSHFADWAIPNSESGKQYLIERQIKPDRIKVIYNGLNMDRLVWDEKRVKEIRQRLNVPEGGKVVGVMARLEAQKDHATFFRSAAIINKKMPDTRYALVGDGELREELEAQCRELGLESKAVFFGHQPDIANFLAAFDVLALTSEAEGCSNTLMEAMSMGKPVVATDVGGNLELIEDGKTGLLVPFGNAREIAGAILSLLRDPEKAGAMGQAAREKSISRFNMEKMVENYQSLYRETLKKKNRRVGYLLTSPGDN